MSMNSGLLSPQNKWKIAAFLSIGLAALLLVLEISPRLKETYQNFTAWQVASHQIAAAANSEALLASTRQAKQAITAKLEEIYASTEDQDQISSVLKSVQKYADESGASVVDVFPKETVPQEDFELLALEINISGSFHQIGTFISVLEQSSPLIQIEEFNLQQSETFSPTLTGSVLLHVRFLGGEA